MQCPVFLYFFKPSSSILHFKNRVKVTLAGKYKKQYALLHSTYVQYKSLKIDKKSATFLSPKQEIRNILNLY